MAQDPRVTIPSATSGGGGGGGITVTSGTYAARPASPAVGDLHYASDLLGVVSRCLVAGTWTNFVRDIKLVDPPSSGWSWQNQSSGGGAATLSTPGSFQSITTTPPTTGNHIRHRVRTAPATPWKLTATFDGFGGSRTLGLALRESSSNRFYRYGLSLPNSTSANYYGVAIYADVGAGPPSSTVAKGERVNFLPESGPTTLSIEDDGTDLIFRVVMPFSGIEIEHYRENRTAFMPSGPDEFGIHVATTGESGHIDLLSWSVT